MLQLYFFLILDQKLNADVGLSLILYNSEHVYHVNIHVYPSCRYRPRRNTSHNGKRALSIAKICFTELSVVNLTSILSVKGLANLSQARTCCISLSLVQL